MTIPFKLKKEDELLILLAQTSMSPEARINVRRLIDEGVKWDYLLNKTSYHGLRPLVYSNLRNYPDIVPKDVLSLLKDHSFKNIQKNLLFMGEMLRLLKLFKKNKVTAIPYKGPVMAVHGYGDLSLREFGDLDIFINKKDFSMVKEILLHENYETVLKLNSTTEKEYMKSQREYKFKNIENGINLEIQWNVVGFSFSFPKEFIFPLNSDVFKFISLNNQSVKIFSDEDLVLILSLHVAGHLWSRLSWICDIVELIKRSEGIDWNQITEKAQYLAIKRVFYLNLSLSRILFDLELPTKIQNCIKEDPQIKVLERQVLKLMFDPENFSFMSKVSLRFKMRENNLNGFKDILRILIIPQSQEWVLFGKTRSTNLVYLLKHIEQIIKRLKE